MVKNCLDEAYLKDHYTSERSCIQCGRFCRGLRWVLLKFGGLCYVCMDGSMDRLIGVDVCLSVCIDVCMYVFLYNIYIYIYIYIYIVCACVCIRDPWADDAAKATQEDQSERFWPSHDAEYSGSQAKANPWVHYTPGLAEARDVRAYNYGRAGHAWSSAESSLCPACFVFARRSCDAPMPALRPDS